MNDYIFSIIVENITEEEADRLLEMLVELLEYAPNVHPAGYLVAEEDDGGEAE